jgi:hypothetical protein
MPVNIPSPLVKLLNRVDEHYIVVCHFVPTRIIRVTAHESFKTFRVEQLVRTNKDNLQPQGTWRTLSTHGGEIPFEAFPSVMNAAKKAQDDLREKIKTKMDRVRKKILRAV